MIMRRFLIFLLSFFFFAISIPANGKGAGSNDPLVQIQDSITRLNDSISKLNQDKAKQEKLIGELQHSIDRQQGEIENLKKENKKNLLASLPKIAFYVFLVIIVALIICLAYRLLKIKKKKCMHRFESDEDESYSERRLERRGKTCVIVSAPKSNLSKPQSGKSYHEAAEDYERKKKMESPKIEEKIVTKSQAVPPSPVVKNESQVSSIVKYCSTLTPGLGGAISVPDRAMKSDFSDSALFKIEIKGDFADISICEENMNRLLEQYSNCKDAFELDNEKPNFTRIKMFSPGRLTKTNGSWLMTNKIKIKCE